VAAARVIEPIDILEDRALGLTACFPAVTPDKLSLNGFEERFNHGIEAPIFVKQQF
jgi:hypothetical protein